MLCVAGAWYDVAGQGIWERVSLSDASSWYCVRHVDSKWITYGVGVQTCVYGQLENAKTELDTLLKESGWYLL